MTSPEHHSVRAIAAAEGACERSANSARLASDEAVALGEPFVRKREPPEPIVPMRVDTGLVEDEIGAEAVDQLRQ